MDNFAQQLDEKINISTDIGSVVQQLAQEINMSFAEFAGEMRKRGCSEPTAMKIWRGEYEIYNDFKDHDLSLSSLRKAADVLKVGVGRLFPETCGYNKVMESVFYGTRLSIADARRS